MEYQKKRRVLRIFSLVVLCIKLSINACVAQDSLHIEGWIENRFHKALDQAKVTLYSIDSTMIENTWSDKKGSFLFSKLEPGMYFIQVKLKDYASYWSTNIRLTGKDLQLDTIQLWAASETLQDVTVSTHQQIMEVKNGVFSYNVSQSPSAVGASALDMVQRLPGVKIDQNDNLQLNGSAGVSVYVDGKKTYLSSKQLNSLLRGIDAGNIKKIELMQSPPSQYDASGTAGIINILTKKKNSAGYALDISALAGFGHYNFNRQDITGNVHLGNWNLYVTLDHNYTTKMFRRKSDNLASDGRIRYSRSINDPQISHYYTYKAGVEWEAGSHDQFGINYTGTLDDWKKNAWGSNTLYDRGNTILSTVENKSVAIEPFRNNAYNFSYVRKIDSMGKKISFDYDYTIFKNNSDGYLSNTAYNADGSQDGDNQELKFHQPNRIHIHSVKADLDLPTQSINLKTGAKYASVSINNHYSYDSLMDGNYSPALSLSDDFGYREKVSAFYASVSPKLGKLETVLGLRYEHTYSWMFLTDKNISVKRHYGNFFPSLSLSHDVGGQSALSLSASRRINRPSYQDLNPMRYYYDKYSYYTGNPNLRPELAWIFTLGYTFKNKYTASLSYNRTSDFVGQTVDEDPSAGDGSVVFKNANFKQKNRYALLVSAPFTVFGFWDITANITPSYTDYPLAQSYGLKNIHIWTLDGSLTQTFKLEANQTLELVMEYTSPELNGIYRTLHYFAINGGYRKTIWKKKMDISFSFNDILHSIRLGGSSQSDLIHYTYKTVQDSRRVALSLVYHIGGKRAVTHSHKTEEQLRL